MKRKIEVFEKAWKIGILTAVPFILVTGPLIGFFIGDWVDRKYHVDPYAKAIFIVLGLVAAVKEIVKIIRDAIRLS